MFYLQYFIENIIMLVSNLVYLSLKSKYLGAVYLGGVLLFLVLGFSFLKNCRKIIVKKEETYDNTHGIIEDILSFKYGPTHKTTNATNKLKNKGINIRANGIKILKFWSNVRELVIHDTPLR